FSVFERFGRLEIHLRGIGLRYLQLTTKFRVVHCRFSRMVTIRHDDVIDWAVTEDHGTRLACHRRRIDENLMFPNREKEPIEIELLLLREPGPLPDTGKQISHNQSIPYRRCLWRSSDSQCGNGVLYGFRHPSQNTCLIRQVD